MKGFHDYMHVCNSKCDTNTCRSVPNDNDGHGTYVTGLAITVAPLADMYMARVANDSDGLENASENIAKVIESYFFQVTKS